MGIWLCKTNISEGEYDVVLTVPASQSHFLRDHIHQLGAAFPPHVFSNEITFSTVGCNMDVPLKAIVEGEEITSQARALRTWIIPNRVCARCKGLLLPSRIPGYKFQCVHHDEDLVSFETVSGEYTPQAFQRFLLEFFSNENMVAQTEFFTKKAPEQTPSAPSAPLLPFGDDCFLNNSSSVDLGTREKIDELDSLELACWNLISDYAKFIGVEIVNKNGFPTDDVSWDVAKKISTTILAEFEKAGVEIKYSTEF